MAAALPPESYDAEIVEMHHRQKVDAPSGTALALGRELRRAGLSVEVGDGSFRLKKSFEAADKVATRVVLLGEDEVARNVVKVKTFATGEQVEVVRTELATMLVDEANASSAKV